MSQEIVQNSQLQDAKTFASIMYVAHCATFLFSMGLLSVLPLIVNYIKRPETKGTFVYSHHGWLIRSFWYYAIAMAIVWILTVTVLLAPVAFVLWIGAWVWQAYRLIKGLMELLENRAMP